MKRTRKQSLPADGAGDASTAASTSTSSPSSSPDAKRPRSEGRRGDAGGQVNESDVTSIVKALRAKPEWQRKVADPTITAKWRAEAVAQGASDASVREALARLLRESVTGAAQPQRASVLGCLLSLPEDGSPDEDDDDLRIEWDEVDQLKQPRDDVCWKDDLVPEDLRARLETKLDAIAAAPDKDFHPGSDDKVQDLIHPSLFPYIRGLSYEPTAQQPASATISKEAERFFKMAARISDDGRFMDEEEDEKEDEDEKNEDEDEAEEEEGEEGKDLDELEDLGADVDTEKEYIKKEKLFQKAESIYQWLPAEFFVDSEGGVSIDSYINNLDRKQHGDLYDDIASIFRLFVPLFEMVLQVPLGNKKLQVIVKAANYVLQPGQTHQGTWHVEGMAHERIVASGIYYYSTTANLAGSSLAFREKRQNDMEERGGTQGWNFNRNIGKAETPAGRCLVFANHLQHKVREMHNKSSEVGVRKILCFFLVDPDHRVKSSADIPMQQWDKIKGEVVRPLIEATVQHKVPLPREIIAMIVNKAKWGFTLEEAKKHREQLMKERKYVISANNELWERPYSFCEH